MGLVACMHGIPVALGGQTGMGSAWDCPGRHGFVVCIYMSGWLLLMVYNSKSIRAKICVGCTTTTTTTLVVVLQRVTVWHSISFEFHSI